MYLFDYSTDTLIDNNQEEPINPTSTPVCQSAGKIR